MITVIVPIYNTEKYLKRCLNSIINQTYKNLEIILVDDGSSDGSSVICDEYKKKDDRITYYRLENGGQGKARNYALDRCHGEWIAFVDSDDWIEKDMYEKMINIAEDNHADIAVCGWYRNHSFQQREQPSLKFIKSYNNFEFMREYLETQIITSSMCNKIYRSYLWENIRFPIVRAREDAAILYRIIAKSKKAVYIGESKYIQYVRPGSTERIGFTESKMHIIDVSYEMKRFIEEYYPELYDSVALRTAKYCVSLMSEIISGFSLKQNKDYYYKLYDKLCNELSLEYSENVRKSSDYKGLKEIIYHQNIFKFKTYIVGIKNCIVDYINTKYNQIVFILKKIIK